MQPYRRLSYSHVRWTLRPAVKHLPKILIVDDNRDNAFLLKELLSRYDYEIGTSHSAEEAAAQIRANPPDLILLDVIMPGRSGYELCQEIKTNPETRLIPVVLITGLTDREDKIHGIEVGADDFLNKPIFPEELFARVKSLLKLKEFTDEMEKAEDVLCTLALSVEARDPYTAGHCERLAGYATELGNVSGSDRKRSSRCAERVICMTSARSGCLMRS